jgi:hypothetical protein
VDGRIVVSLKPKGYFKAHPEPEESDAAAVAADTIPLTGGVRKVGRAKCGLDRHPDLGPSRARLPPHH